GRRRHTQCGPAGGRRSPHAERHSRRRVRGDLVSGTQRRWPDCKGRCLGGSFAKRLEWDGIRWMQGGTYMADVRQEKSVNTANYWLARAEGVRAVAKATKDLRVRRHLLGSAEGYEKVAQIVAADLTISQKSTESGTP